MNDGIEEMDVGQAGEGRGLKNTKNKQPGSRRGGAERLGFGPGVQDLPHGGGDFTPSEGLLFFVLLCELMPRKKMLSRTRIVVTGEKRPKRLTSSCDGSF